MRVLEVHAPGQWSIQERPAPTPGGGEALLRPLAVGICGSDLDLLAGTRPADYVRYPVVPGHEWSAEVVALGAGVRHVAPGDYVAVEGHNYCRTCYQCRRGLTNLCEHYDEFGFTREGGLAERVVARADLLHPFRRDLPPEYGALTEPAACAVYAVELVAPQAGENIVVIGPGTIGLLGVALFALCRPQRLIVVGRRDTHRDVALRLGATDFVTGSAGEVKEAVLGLTDRRGADIVYEAAGAASAVLLAIDLARRGGRIVYEGVAGNAQITLDPDVFLLKALRIYGGFAYTPNAFERALRLIESGHINAAALVTHRLPLDRYGDGLALLKNHTERVIKVAVFPQQGEVWDNHERS